MCPNVQVLYAIVLLMASHFTIGRTRNVGLITTVDSTSMGDCHVGRWQPPDVRSPEGSAVLVRRNKGSPILLAHRIMLKALLDDTLCTAHV